MEQGCLRCKDRGKKMTEQKKGWFTRLKEGLQKSSTKLSEGITNIVSKRKLDEEHLNELEELLITSDIGVATSRQIIQDLAKKRFNQEVTVDEVKSFLAEEITQILSPVAQDLVIDHAHRPFVILVVGVNGSGKTTTIGKLAHYWKEHGHKVRIVAGDTFRAAAVEQLKVWADRAGVPIIMGRPESDPAGLAFSALEQSRQEGDDILIIDTAGRLQNKEHLMAELQKIERVLKKIDPATPHSCLLVLDANVGQNAHSQVDLFKATVNLTGLVLTKLDGTAKGGVLMSLAEKHQLPVYAVGVGEGIDDLQPFSANDFAHGLLGID
jgi:fused signal recognition particle receptor